MAPGDLLTAPGQVEWDGLLFDVSGAALSEEGSGLWLTSASVTDGWYPLYEADDLATPSGTSLGTPRQVVSNPTVPSVAVETAALVLEVEASMRPTSVARPLCWWDRNRNLKFLMMAAPRQVPVSTAAGTQFYSHRLADLVWVRKSKGLHTVAEHSTTVNASNPTVPNAGSDVAPWRLVVAGACTHPRVRNMTTDQAWRFDDLTLTSGQTLTVDTRAMTAVVSETGEDDVSVWHRATDDDGRLAMLWGIRPGGTPVGFASDAGATSATLYNPDAY